MRYIDLFAGTGGFSTAFKKFDNFKCVFANDFSKSSKKIYEQNYPENNFIFEDLHKIDVVNIPEHDLLCGGFPCQPFSIAGKRKGMKDERSNVFWKIIEILTFHKPKIVILENVKNLVTHDNKKTFKVIIDSLKELGYFVKYSVLDTSKITNIPQHRERIFIICFLDINNYNKFNFDFNIVENNSINFYLENDVTSKYYYTEKLKVYNTIKESVTEHNVIYQYRRHYVRKNKTNRVPTLTANMGGGGHNVPIILDNKGIRKLTPKECFNLQGFPQDYNLNGLSDTELYKLAGNAITVNVVELIIQKILQ